MDNTVILHNENGVITSVTSQGIFEILNCNVYNAVSDRVLWITRSRGRRQTYTSRRLWSNGVLKNLIFQFSIIA